MCEISICRGHGMEVVWKKNATKSSPLRNCFVQSILFISQFLMHIPQCLPKNCTRATARKHQRNTMPPKFFENETHILSKSIPTRPSIEMNRLPHGVSQGSVTTLASSTISANHRKYEQNIPKEWGYLLFVTTESSPMLRGQCLIFHS